MRSFIDGRGVRRTLAITGRDLARIRAATGVDLGDLDGMLAASEGGKLAWSRSLTDLLAIIDVVLEPPISSGDDFDAAIKPVLTEAMEALAGAIEDFFRGFPGAAAAEATNGKRKVAGTGKSKKRRQRERDKRAALLRELIEQAEE